MAPSLADNNMMRHVNKADLLGCLETLGPPSKEIPQAYVKIIDGAALVQSLDPKTSSMKIMTFNEYAHHVFLPYNTLNGSNKLSNFWMCMGHI